MSDETATPTDQAKNYQFQAEIQSLLKLLSHSLYQHRGIAIRELISNASDALDKRRHQALIDADLAEPTDLQIDLIVDSENGKLSIRDNGIGMSEADLIENLGTIAHSGSLAYLQQMQASGSEANPSLIGQFGVGFYSAFMLADRVDVFTRRLGEQTVQRWSSEGTGEFTISEIDPAEHAVEALASGPGTEVQLHLKAGEEEGTKEEFTDPNRLRSLIRRYSTFVPHPIRLEDETLNDQRPVWLEPRDQVSEDEYAGFYRYLTHAGGDEKPLWTLHRHIDSPMEFHALLFCPPTNFERLGFGRDERGMHLCVKRILVQDDCRELLPEYLRFVRGVVDSTDLPLNVSRETLQDDAVFRRIKKVLTKQVLKHLESLAKSDPEEYLEFYRQFGITLREGVGSDFGNRELLGKLLRFSSTHGSDSDLVGLAEVAERAGEREQIYFVTGSDRATLLRNPNLETFHERELEVLLLDDPVDEFVLTQLGEFEGKTFVSIDSADLELPAADGKESDSEDANEEPPGGFEVLLTLFKDSLGERVTDVRASKRLTTGSVALVTPAGTPSVSLQRLMQLGQGASELPPPPGRIFEVNPKSDLIKRLALLASSATHVEFVKDCGRQLLAGAELIETPLPDAADTASRSERFMQELAEARSPITA